MELRELIQRSKTRPEVYAPALAVTALQLESERDRLAGELAECRGQLNRVVDMNKRYQRMVNEASPYMVCENMHHDKRDQHRLDEDCPVVARWHTGIDSALAGEGDKP